MKFYQTICPNCNRSTYHDNFVGAICTECNARLDIMRASLDATNTNVIEKRKSKSCLKQESELCKIQ